MISVSHSEYEDTIGRKDYQTSVLVHINALLLERGVSQEKEK